MNSYVIWDSKNDFFWQKNIRYGYNYQNKSVFEARFVETLAEATELSFTKATEVLARFQEEDFIVGGRVRGELPVLSIKLKHTPESIVEILKSITKLSVKDGELDVWFDDDQDCSGVRGYLPGSFTRELLQLIEDHLLGNYEQDT